MPLTAECVFGSCGPMIPQLPALPGRPRGWVAQPRHHEGLRALPAGTTHVWQCPAC